MTELPTRSKSLAANAQRAFHRLIGAAQSWWTPKAFGKALYRGRARIEQAIGKLKRFKRIAPRCEKTKQNFGSFVAIAAAFILVKSVHTA